MLPARMKRWWTVTMVLALAGCASVAPPGAGPVPASPSHEKVEASQPPPAEQPFRTDGRAEVAGPGPSTERPSDLPPPASENVPFETPRVETPDSAGALVADERVLLIESTPSGATVVIDGRPVGKTPHRLAVAGTQRGFFRAETEIRVRFIASSAEENSATVSENFGPTDRVPARVIFTPQGARRVW